jgi:hypothetical protein
MSKRIPILITAVTFVTVGLIATRHGFSQTNIKSAVSAPVNVAAYAIAVRTATEVTVTPSTRKIGLEVYRDATNGNLIYITETGSIAVVPGK